jgi:large subunit ribosomal protein L18e
MKSNAILRSQAVALERKGRKEKKGLWRDAARHLSASKLNETVVNVGLLSRIARAESAPEALLVPGKVLASGLPDRKMIVGAFSFSDAARRKIIAAGGETLTIPELLGRYPEGKGVRLVK